MIRAFLGLVLLLTSSSISFALPQRAVFDFDGDNKSDYAVLRVTNNNFIWYLQQSTAGYSAVQWGVNFDFSVPADYDGDLKWDFAVWRAGTFYILQSSNNTLRVVQWGQNGDDPARTQDFDGDGKADPTVVRVVGGNKIWYILRSTLGFKSAQFGLSGDYAVAGDFDGDKQADLAVYRSNTFYVLRSSDGGLQTYTFGTNATDHTIPADFDGDGKTDYAVWRSTNGVWYWIASSNGSFHAVEFGNSSDLPTPGDYDGDGKADQSVWRTGSPGVFYTNRSTLGFTALQFGTTNDFALAFYDQID